MYRYICSFYGRETVHDEFKVFCINTSTWQHFFENEEVYAIFHNTAYVIDRQRFDQMINAELGNYYERYFSKYIACFVSSGIKGTIHIGIADSGIIEGIPIFNHVLDAEHQEHVKKCFATTLRIKTSMPEIDLNTIMQHISITFTELEQNDLVTDIDNSSYVRLITHINAKNKCKQKWEDYKYQYKEWHDELFKYNIKLRELINMQDVQLCIANYISNKKKDYACDLSDVIAYYNSGPIIEYDITMQMICDVKEDYQHPIYWLISYKDYKIDIIRHTKPIAPVQQSSDFNYVNFAQHMTNIRPYLLTQKCKFYALSITVNQIDNCLLEYLNVKGEWRTKKRIMYNESIGPITTDYD